MNFPFKFDIQNPSWRFRGSQKTHWFVSVPHNKVSDSHPCWLSFLCMFSPCLWVSPRSKNIHVFSSTLDVDRHRQTPSGTLAGYKFGKQIHWYSSFLEMDLHSQVGTRLLMENVAVRTQTLLQRCLNPVFACWHRILTFLHWGSHNSCPCESSLATADCTARTECKAFCSDSLRSVFFRTFL